jgi:predicted transglutaminase-like cysteine proteinase
MHVVHLMGYLPNSWEGSDASSLPTGSTLNGLFAGCSVSSVLTLLAGLYSALTLGPPGFYDMCSSQQAECKPVAQSKNLTLSEIVRINQLVNKDIRPVPEPAGKDVWTIAPKAGDCDDFAMTKRHDLIEEGLGSAEARVAVGFAEGQLHAVLVVNVDSDYYVLDNLTDEVLPVEKSAVRIVSVQSPGNPRVWLRSPGEPSSRSLLSAALK